MNEVTNNLNSLGVFKDFSDGSIKSVFQTLHNDVIEMTLLFNKPDYDVVCVPTHHFCNLGCKMCHLTNNNLNKKMVQIKECDFIEALQRTVSIAEMETDGTINYRRRSKKTKLLISFMGVGEPLLNLALIESIYLREQEIKEKLKYSDICYAISTMMPNNIKKLINLVEKYHIPLKLHFSMHSPFDNERFALLPSTKICIDDALSALQEYKCAVINDSDFIAVYKKFHSIVDPIEIHYTLIENVNDSETHLKKMVDLLNKYNITIKFIRFNPTNELKRSNYEQQWLDKIRTELPNLRVKVYSPPGREIGSSCGEFTKHYYHEEIETHAQYVEFKTWERRHKIFENGRKNILEKDEYYMGIAILTSLMSEDPSTQVGVCLVGDNQKFISVGYNKVPDQFPSELVDWNTKEAKYTHIIHAEINAILNCINSYDLNGASIYVTIFPCEECSKIIAQCGIKSVIYLSDKYFDTNRMNNSRQIFDICGISYNKYDKSIEDINLIYNQ